MTVTVWLDADNNGTWIATLEQDGKRIDISQNVIKAEVVQTAMAIAAAIGVTLTD